MEYADAVKAYYLEHIPDARPDGKILKAPCPFCQNDYSEKPGTIVVYLDPDGFFLGYFRCLNRCTPGGFPLYFGKLMGIDRKNIPGYDPDREPFVRDVVYPTKNLNNEIKKYRFLMDDDKFKFFNEFGVSKAVVQEMKVGYNGRYLVYPYYMEDGNCYAARCVLPEREEDFFWYGEDRFYTGEFRVFNDQEIDRCEDGTLFITDGEKNLLTLKELGYPGIAVPSIQDLEFLSRERLAYVKNVFILLNNTPEAHLAARSLGTRLGFKARILKYPVHLKRGYNLCDLSRDKEKAFRSALLSMIEVSQSFSPFSPPAKEERSLDRMLEREKGMDLLGLRSGFGRLDQALNGIRGISIMGGQPKAGKSSFFMQISTDMARMKTPVIYYDFENGRQKIYTRTLCRISRLSDREIRLAKPGDEISKKLEKARQEFSEMLPYFRVVTDRKLNPDIMRRQIDFLQHETRKDFVLLVVDSLHKLPFRDLSERRTGIDEWLRHMEAIRDEQNASFLVVSELSRGDGGTYSGKPDLGSFKESGDIEYSADNAMILVPDWDPLDPITSKERNSTLWLVASRENSPGKIADYILEYPLWGFREVG
jgi:KaiC/GvpD/RAD55 family RecA-like ATPase